MKNYVIYWLSIVCAILLAVTLTSKWTRMIEVSTDYLHVCNQMTGWELNALSPGNLLDRQDCIQNKIVILSSWKNDAQKLRDVKRGVVSMWQVTPTATEQLNAYEGLK